jgi:hypothetical protein
MKLERLGWSDFFEAQFAPLRARGLCPPGDGRGRPRVYG